MGISVGEMVGKMVGIRVGASVGYSVWYGVGSWVVGSILEWKKLLNRRQGKFEITHTSE